MLSFFTRLCDENFQYLFSAPATATLATMAWTGLMPCNAATTRCQACNAMGWVLLFILELICSTAMWPNPWVKRSMTRSPNTSLSVRIFTEHQVLWFIKENVRTKLKSSANGGDKQNAWWLGGTDLHHEVQSLPLGIHPQWYCWPDNTCSTTFSGKLVLDVRSTLVIRTLGRGYFITKQDNGESHLTQNMLFVLWKVSKRTCSIVWDRSLLMQESQIRMGMRTAPRWTHRMRVMGWVDYHLFYHIFYHYKKYWSSVYNPGISLIHTLWLKYNIV